MVVIVNDKQGGKIAECHIGNYLNVSEAIKNILTNLGLRRCDVEVVTR